MALQRRISFDPETPCVTGSCSPFGLLLKDFLAVSFVLFRNRPNVLLCLLYTISRSSNKKKILTFFVKKVSQKTFKENIKVLVPLLQKRRKFFYLE
jgi:hypothetical protein